METKEKEKGGRTESKDANANEDDSDSNEERPDGPCNPICSPLHPFEASKYNPGYPHLQAGRRGRVQASDVRVL